MKVKKDELARQAWAEDEHKEGTAGSRHVLKEAKAEAMWEENKLKEMRTPGKKRERQCRSHQLGMENIIGRGRNTGSNEGPP